jgi:hypothetical protein
MTEAPHRSPFRCKKTKAEKIIDNPVIPFESYQNTVHGHIIEDNHPKKPHESHNLNVFFFLEPFKQNTLIFHYLKPPFTFFNKN